MNICILHAYLLEGSGSNIYVQNLARAYCKLGHDVTLICQARKVKEYDFVTSYHRFNTSNTAYSTIFKKRSPYKGKCQVFNTDIGSLLPVYIEDYYAHFKVVKAFQRLTKAELKSYIDRNVKVLRHLLKTFDFNFIHTNHVLMSPYIAYEATKGCPTPYVTSCHGSALNYTVRKYPKLKKYAVKGLQSAKRIFSPSHYFSNLLFAEFSKQVPAVKAKTKIIPNGVDTDSFKPTYNTKRRHISALHRVLKGVLKDKKRGKTERQKINFHRDLSKARSYHAIKRTCEKYRDAYDMHHPDKSIIETLKQINWKKDRIVLYVGKFISSKGPQSVIRAIPYLIDKHPNMKFMFVGFGSYREYLETLLFALQHNKMSLFNQISTDDGTGVKSILKANDFKKTQDTILDRIVFTGILEHSELKYLIPLVDILIVPSLFPETFGMIAAEGMASGVPTLVTHQSGLADMHEIMSKLLKSDVTLKKMHVHPNLPKQMADNIDALIKTGTTRNRRVKKALHDYAKEHFSWDKIAKQCILLSSRRKRGSI